MVTNCVPVRLVTPNFGPGTEDTHVYRAWHAQQARVGTPDRKDLPGCDSAVDDLGRDIWLADHDLKASTPKKCAAVNFSDYSRDDADAMRPESTGDGRISTYVPYAYDAAIAIAKGLHSLFNSKEWRDGMIDWNSPQARGNAIFKHISSVSFEGFSGSVSFRAKDPVTNKYEGDRNAASVKFFLWNYDGESGSKFEKLGEVGANGQLNITGSRRITWPSGGEKPDDRPKCTDSDFNLFLHPCDSSTGMISLNISHDAASCKGTDSTEQVCEYTPFRPLKVSLS